MTDFDFREIDIPATLRELAQVIVAATGLIVALRARAVAKETEKRVSRNSEKIADITGEPPTVEGKRKP